MQRNLRGRSEGAHDEKSKNKQAFAANAENGREIPHGFLRLDHPALILESCKEAKQASRRDPANEFAVARAPKKKRPALLAGAGVLWEEGARRNRVRRVPCIFESLCFVIPVSSRFFWCVLGLLLSAATVVVWQWRFVAVSPGKGLPGQEEAKLAFCLLQGGDHISWSSPTAADLRPASTLETPLGGFRGATHALVSFRASCEGLGRGRLRWDMGRVILNWRNQDGSPRPAPVGLRLLEGTQPTECFEMVMPLEFARGVPCLTLQNTGSSGTFHIEQLRIVPLVQRRGFWQAASLLVLLWFLWMANGIRMMSDPPSRRSTALAAGFTVIVVWFGILPGPWIPYHGILGLAFQPGPLPAAYTDALDLRPTQTPSSRASLSALPTKRDVPSGEQANWSEEIDQGTVINLIRVARTSAPFLLHFFSFAGLAVLYSMILNGSRGWVAAIPAVLAAGSEMMEVFFGFGCDMGDLAQLGLDLLGIVVGSLAWRLAKPGFERLVVTLRRKHV